MQLTRKIEPIFQRIRNLSKGDTYIWGATILLAVISMLVVYSATGSLAYKMNKGNTESYLIKQILFTLLGLLFVFVFHRFNYAVFSRFAILFYGASIVLLIYTLFFGAQINDGSRWVKIPVINLTIQSSDVGKLALYIYLSKVLSRKQDKVDDFKQGFLPLIIPIGLTCLLIFPANLSNGLLTFATSMLLLFIGRVNFKFLLATVGICLIPVLLLVIIAVTSHKTKDVNDDIPTTTVTAEPGLFKRAGTWVSRVQNFIYNDGTGNKDGDYQINQAKIAIANGSVFYGLGPGNSQQRNFLPQAYNDFIFSIIIEEYGIIGGAFIAAIYLFFLFRCIKIFRRCPFAFGAFLALALSFTLAIQAIANMAVNVNIMPVTGVTLPLVSMGGSSFLFTCMSIGIILSVSRYVEKIEGQRSRKVGALVEQADIQGIPITEKEMEAGLTTNNIDLN